MKTTTYEDMYTSFDEKREVITIPMEEYKELLMIKGKYEELKNMYMPTYPKTNITYNGIKTIEPDTYKVSYANFSDTCTAGYCAIQDPKGDETDFSDLEEFVREG